MLANLPTDASAIDALKSQFATAAEQMKSAGVSDEVIAEAQKHLDALGGTPSGDSGESGGTSVGVLLAVQDVNGAYLIGWGAQKADDRWVFSNAPNSTEIRPRASAFDGIGQDGFRAMTFASAVPDAAKLPPATPGSGGGSGGGGGGGGGESPSPSDPASPPSSPPVQPPAAPPGSPKGPKLPGRGG